MLFAEWIDAGRTPGAKKPERSVKQFALNTGIAFTTLLPIYHGKPVKSAATARTINERTNGDVSLDELFTPDEYGARSYKPKGLRNKKRRSRKKAA